MLANLKRSTIDKLINALKAMGYNYGYVNLTDEEAEVLVDLSSQEMVKIYAEKNNLPEKNQVYAIIIEAYKNSLDPSAKAYSVRDAISRAKLKNPEYEFAFNESILFRREGNTANRRHIWIQSRKPTFSDAESLVSFVKELRDYKLSENIKDMIKENADLNSEEMMQLINPDDDLFIKFKARGFHYNVKSIAKNKGKKKKKEELPPKEVGRKAPDQPLNVIDESLDMRSESDGKIDKKKFKAIGEKLENKSLVFMLSKRMDLYIKMDKQKNKIIKGLTKYVKQLEGEVLNLQSQLNKEEKK